MMKRRPDLVGLPAVGLLVATCCLLTASGLAAATITVEPSGKRLAAALVTAGPGDTLMLRTGVHPLAAVVSSLLFLVDDQFWHAAVVPETYSACMFLLVAGIWAYASWLNDGAAWNSIC